MKNLKLFMISCMTCSSMIIQGQAHYDVTSGEGNGFRFWGGSNNYKIHMGNSGEYHFGPVTGYSIKMNMNEASNRGWTWGVIGKTPIAALNTLGNFQIAGGAQFRRAAISTVMGSTENGWVRDAWLTGNYSPPKWDQTTGKWVRAAGNYNDIGGIIWRGSGTYFIRDSKGEQLEYSNSELLNKAFLFSDINTGNVGIGTIAPGNWKLAVNGEIRAKEIKVETGWSDFVFKNDYALPTLEEVEKHIKEKGHLKDIPSAKEVEENGIYLGEMDSKLLQKIEELTLYIIEQNKRIEALENKLDNCEHHEK